MKDSCSVCLLFVLPFVLCHHKETLALSCPTLNFVCSNTAESNGSFTSHYAAHFYWIHLTIWLGNLVQVCWNRYTDKVWRIKHLTALSYEEMVNSFRVLFIGQIPLQYLNNEYMFNLWKKITSHEEVNVILWAASS